MGMSPVLGISGSDSELDVSVPLPLLLDELSDESLLSLLSLLSSPELLVELLLDSFLRRRVRRVLGVIRASRKLGAKSRGSRLTGDMRTSPGVAGGVARPLGNTGDGVFDGGRCGLSAGSDGGADGGNEGGDRVLTGSREVCTVGAIISEATSIKACIAEEILRNSDGSTSGSLSVSESIVKGEN